MTKQLERLNIPMTYSLYPYPPSHHRHIYLRARKRGCSYNVLMFNGKYGSKSFRNKSDALCYKFIIILLNKSKT